METDEIYTYRGKVKIGYSVLFSWTIELGLGSIHFFQDKIIVSAFPFRKTIPYSKIKNLVWSSAGYIKFEHNAGGFPFVAFWALGKNDPSINRIYKILKEKGVSLEKPKNI